MNRRVTRPVLLHSARTALATVASLLVARLFRLPEAYWAPITTIVILLSRAVDGVRTRDPELGKLVLYQLSYYRTG
jgi:uncharacterized membrane protein YccC